MRVLICLLLFAYSALGVNFSFVQQTPSTGAGSQAFPSNTTAGNCIIVILYGQVSTPSVSDSAGNTYTHLGSVGGFPVKMDIYSADHIAGGADTVTATAGGVAALEYHSVSSAYNVVMGGTSSGNGVLSNAGTGFTSASEVLVVFGATCNCGGGSTWTVTTGTIRYTSTMPFNFGQIVTGGDDIVASMAGTYSNSVKINGVTPGSETVISAFINLGAGGGGTNVFPIIY